MGIERSLLSVVIVVVLAGCTPSTQPAPATSTVAATVPPSPTPTTGVATTGAPTDAATTGGATSRVTGTLTSVDDVEGGGTSPGTGTVAIVPTEREGGLWEAIEFTPDDQALATVGGLVDPQVVAGTTVVDVVDGTFEADVPDGEHVVCLLGGTGPYLLQGCARATVDGPATWELTRGEGGLNLSS